MCLCHTLKAASAMFLLCAAMAMTSPAQTFTTLLNFDGTDGSQPLGPLTQGTDGNLYGTTIFGGAHRYGTVFKMTPRAGTLTTLYNFCSQTNCQDGAYPTPGLVLAIDGNFYGTTNSGGTGGSGTVFKITPNGTLTTLHTFAFRDGANPTSGLVQATDGNFYGTTSFGGTAAGCAIRTGCGTVFRIMPAGTFTTLHNFEGSDGGEPLASLIQATDGNFYGTTYGGANGYGTVFKMTPGGTLTTLHSFSASDDGPPYTALVQATDGNFYGTTVGPDFGSVYRITSDGILTTLHTFDGTDGGASFAALIQATDGNLYGATTGGGANNEGTIFTMTLGGTLTTLYNFCPQAGCPDGYGPIHTLFQHTNGNLYGAAADGGTNNSCGADGCGTIFGLAVDLVPFVRTVPASGKVGTRVRILGSGLASATSVTFNGTAAAFTVASGTQIETTVPAAATTGTVQVITAKGPLNSNMAFRVRQ